jgi:hypothetical protein
MILHAVRPMAHLPARGGVSSAFPANFATRLFGATVRGRVSREWRVANRLRSHHGCQSGPTDGRADPRMKKEVEPTDGRTDPRMKKEVVPRMAERTHGWQGGSTDGRADPRMKKEVEPTDGREGVTPLVEGSWERLDAWRVRMLGNLIPTVEHGTNRFRRGTVHTAWPAVTSGVALIPWGPLTMKWTFSIGTRETLDHAAMV